MAAAALRPAAAGAALPADTAARPGHNTWMSAVVRWLEKIAPGSGYARSAAFFFVWFSTHSLLVLVFHSRRNGYYARASRREVLS